MEAPELDVSRESVTFQIVGHPMSFTRVTYDDLWVEATQTEKLLVKIASGSAD